MIKKSTEKMMSKIYDVIIIGGGIMGSATAYYLMKMDNTLKVVVLERDPTYAQASTTLSMANVRIQFSLKQNIEISQYALETLENFEETMAVQGDRPKIYYRREGNLFLVDEAGRRGADKALALQQSLGCRADWWSPEKIKRYYPLYDTGDLAGGTFGPDDGHFDAHAVLMAYKAKAKSMGAEFLKGEVEKIQRQHGGVSGVGTVSGSTLTADRVVNAAGAWAARVAATAGVKLPVVPVKRQVFALDTAVKPQGPLPLTILPTGLYFRTETGGLILLGKSMQEDPIGYEFRWDDKRFMEILWPELAAFVPAFDRLKLVRGWAGLYAVNSLDGNAILGEWPEIKGLFLANGFSGHGLQQAPAVGRYLAELILEHPLSLDLSIFSPIRILENRPLNENGLV
ncbi:MAG: FAD-binding oxidoreductase [Desulfobacteraceae bacterium]|nr:FAD-binding oxidoreductase [Desulfobacteraceae bacterium]